MEQAPKYLFIRELDLFKSLDDVYIQQISNQSSFESFKRGKFIFDVGDPLCFVYIIRKGSIKVGLNGTLGVYHINLVESILSYNCISLRKHFKNQIYSKPYDSFILFA